MAMKQHLEALRMKHQTLEAKLRELLNHRSCSAEELTMVKREKLAIKEEIKKAEQFL